MAKRPETDEKAEALKRHRSLHPEPERVADARFQQEEFFDPRDLVQVKYEMLRRAREEDTTVTDAAEAFGFSRPTFYEARRRLTEEGLPGLVPKRPGPKGAHKLTDEVMAFVERLRAEAPEAEVAELAARVEERFGLSVHPRSIERALERRGKKRRKSG